jgi:hypothetical protein
VTFVSLNCLLIITWRMKKKIPYKPTFVSPASEALATSTSESCISSGSWPKRFPETG